MRSSRASAALTRQRRWNILTRPGERKTPASQTACRGWKAPRRECRAAWINQGEGSKPSAKILSVAMVRVTGMSKLGLLSGPSSTRITAIAS